MATPSDPPKWFFAEAVRRPDTLDINLRVALRSHDGWVKVLDLTQDGWASTDRPTRRQLLENMQHNITLQLAELTLEET